MKKTVSVVLALALVFVLSLSAFAEIVLETPRPQYNNDLQGWTDYYTELLGHASENPQEVISMLIADYQSGDINQDTFQTALQDAAMNVAGESESIQNIVNTVQTVIGAIESGSLPEGVTLPEDITLPELPSEFPSDITLPSIDGGDSGNGSFLDTILGALGGIIDGIFGGGESEDPTVPSGDNNGGDDEDLWGSDDDPFNDNSLGDTSVIAVAAVAVVAGAALVLTRKKSKDEDAE